MRHAITRSVMFMAALVLLPATGWTAPFNATVTKLLESGPSGEKKNFVIIGDGWTAAEQATYNNLVNDRVMNGLFKEGPLWEDMSAFNIYRINVDSTDSGVTQVHSPTVETLVPDVAPNGSQLTFTLSAAAHLPVLPGIKIREMNGGTETRVIQDHGASLSATVVDIRDNWSLAASVVTGTFDRSTGIATFTYTAGNAPPAGATFQIDYPYVTTQRSTVLEFGYSGDWNHCYFHTTANTEPNTLAILNDLVPDWNYYTVILNETGGGGCSWGGNVQVLTRSEGWQVYAHESGHMVGGLCDEYTTPKAFTDPEPGCVNATKNNTNRATLKWVDFLNPTTTFPDTPWTPATMDPAETVGHWEGAVYATTGVWRSAYNGRMNGNVNAFGPVGYDHIKDTLSSFHDHDFNKTFVGDFDGDGRSDLVVHNETALELYISDGTHTLPRWVHSTPLGIWDYFAPNDQFLVGDFNGDGRDDLFVYNMVDFSIPYFALLRAVSSPGFGFDAITRYDETLPGWGTMMPGDRFYVADFDGDGKDDIYITNTMDFSIGYLGMLRSSGTELQMVHRFDDVLPGWDRMQPGDQFYTANIDGTGGRDLYVINNADWCSGYLISLLSMGNTLARGVRYDQVIPGWADLRPGDQYSVADFEGSGRDGLYAFNGNDWSVPYLGVFRNIGGGALDVPVLHEGFIEGWDALQPNDRFLVANVDGQPGSDLYGWNFVDWSNRYVGRLQARSDGFRGSWQMDVVGKWGLTNNDVFHVGNFDGTAGGAVDDLFVHVDVDPTNTGDEYLGLLRNAGSVLDGGVVYFRWIHHYFYHSSGYW